MGTVTAQILVGASHSNHGGIEPSHALFLSENSRPAWVLQGISILGQAETSERITWIPFHPETILQDAIVMVGIHVARDEGLIKSWHISTEGKPYKDDFVSLYEVLSDTDHDSLINLSKNLAHPLKIAITCFEDSSALGQLKSLAEYLMDLEVCVSRFSRYYSGWEKETIVRGSLEDAAKRLV